MDGLLCEKTSPYKRNKKHSKVFVNNGFQSARSPPPVAVTTHCFVNTCVLHLNFVNNHMFHLNFVYYHLQTHHKCITVKEVKNKTA